MVKRLEMERKIEKISIDPRVVKESIQIAERDLDVASKNLEINDEWAYNISYTAILSAGRALIFSKGYRPKGDEQHKTVKEFLTYYLKSDDVAVFDRMRRKRHAATYDISSIVTHTDAENAVRQATAIVSRIKAIIEKDGFDI
jgi:uncharacterized protein (UPF0332 family)